MCQQGPLGRHKMKCREGKAPFPGGCWEYPRCQSLARASDTDHTLPWGLRGSWRQPPLEGVCPGSSRSFFCSLGPTSAWGSRCDWEGWSHPYLSPWKVARPSTGQKTPEPRPAPGPSFLLPLHVPARRWGPTMQMKKLRLVGEDTPLLQTAPTHAPPGPERLPLSCLRGAPHGGSRPCVCIAEPWWQGVDVWEQEDPEVGGGGQGRRNELGVVEGVICGVSQHSKP